MEPIKIAIAWMANSSGALGESTVSFPFGYTVIILVFGALCLLWGKFRLGFIAAYGYVFYLTFILQKWRLIEMFGGESTGLVVYMFTIMALTILTFVGLLQEDR
jgi:hypothetical protein